MKSFNEIYILNLHGNAKRQEIAPDGGKDENVFDITQGTTISIFVKAMQQNGCGVYYADVWGNRKSKYALLAESSAEAFEWQEIEPKEPLYEFVPINTKWKGEYEKGWKVNKVFHRGSNGVQTLRDNLVVSINKEELKERFAKIWNRSFENGSLKEELKISDRSFWKFSDARKTLQKDSDWEKHIQRYLYRPFDREWFFTSGDFVHRLRWEVMQHLSKENIGICVGRAGLVASGSWDLVFCIREVCDHNLFYRGSSFNMPLYLYINKGQVGMDFDNWPVSNDGRIPNLSRDFVEELGERIKLEFVSDGRGDLKATFGPEDIFDYIYGVLHSPEYRRRYAEFLKTDFPRVPWPKNREIFQRVCEVGGQLVSLHSMETEVLEEADRRVLFDVEGSGVIEEGYPKYIAHADKPEQGKVYINKDQFFEGVRPDVWEFRIGGYQVCEKWIKDRRGRNLRYDDVKHYQKIVVALGETIRLMRQVDEVINTHGGWPIK